MIRLLLGLEVVEKDGSLLRLLTPVLNHDARAVDDLSCVTLAIQDACSPLLVSVADYPGYSFALTETSPLAQLLAIGNLDQGDLVLRAKRNHELLVCLLLA
jgi:hypothetical protein